MEIENSLISNCTVARSLSSFAIIITKQLALSVMRPFHSSPAVYHTWSIMTMRLSCTIMEIEEWHGNGDGGNTAITAVITAVMGTTTSDVNFREFYFLIWEFLFPGINEKSLNSVERLKQRRRSCRLPLLLWASQEPNTRSCRCLVSGQCRRVGDMRRVCRERGGRKDADGGCGRRPRGCQDIRQRSNISYFTKVHSFSRSICLVQSLQCIFLLLKLFI